MLPPSFAKQSVSGTLPHCLLIVPFSRTYCGFLIILISATRTEIATSTRKFYNEPEEMGSSLLC